LLLTRGCFCMLLCGKPPHKGSIAEMLAALFWHHRSPSC
jgi:hypothetical protein